MTSRERLDVSFRHGIPDTVPIVDISYWTPTLERWRKEGLPEGVSPQEFLGLDIMSNFGVDSSLQLPTETIEEAEEWVVEKDANGVTVKRWKTHYATPLQMDFTIKGRKEWFEYKERLKPEPSRVDAAIRKKVQEAKEGDRYVTLNTGEPVWCMLRLLGHDNALMLMLDDPKLTDDVLRTYTEFSIGMAEVIKGMGVEFDAIWFFSDLCYKNGMLFSPRTYRELVMNYHKRVAEYCRSIDVRLLLHCDGDVRELIPLLIEAGFDAIQPLEARCGNDVRVLKPIYGTRIVFFGNISVDVMSRSKEEIRQEVVSKVTVAKQGGGYVYHCDHSIPPTVSFENYRYVIELVREYGRY